MKYLGGSALQVAASSCAPIMNTMERYRFIQWSTGHVIQHFNSVGSIQLLSGVFTFHRRQGMDTSSSDRACILDDGRPGLRPCLIPKWLLPYPSGMTSEVSPSSLAISSIPSHDRLTFEATFTNINTSQLFQPTISKLTRLFKSIS